MAKSQKIEAIPPAKESVFKAEPMAIEKPEDELRKLQDELFRSSLEVSTDAMKFSEVDPAAERAEDDPIFLEWVKSFGRKRAERKYRVARAGWMAKKDAPVGILESTSMAVGIMKARAVEKGGARILNVGTVNMYAEIPTQPEKEVE